MMRVDPRAITRLAMGRSTALVTGTNGKTTTTYLLARALGDEVAHNHTGANMSSGVVTALADSRTQLATIEVDELHFPSIAQMIEPSVVILLNVSRDQLDRSHEVARVVSRWSTYLATASVTVIANCADPNVVAAAAGKRTVWVDPGQRWPDDALTCPRCGGLIAWSDVDWRCDCGFAMPRADYRVEDGVVIGPDGVQYALNLAIPGDFNRGNAAFALVAAVVMGVDAHTAVGRMETLQSASGRYLRYDVGGRPARLVLAKNPAGMRAALGLVGDAQVIVGINAREVDGRDTSWLYDAPFEMLGGRVVGATGERADDLALRLQIAGADPVVDADIGRLARRLPPGDLVFVGNYSNFIAWRRGRVWTP